MIIPLIANSDDFSHAGDISCDKPSSNFFDTIVGQDQARKQIKFYIDSHSEDTPVPTLLFTGSQGLGKSYFAERLSKCLNRRLIEVNCAQITSVSSFINDIVVNSIMGEEPVTLLFDESHELIPDISTMLLTALSPCFLKKNIVGFKKTDFLWDMTRINVVFATTHGFKMFKPLINRCSEVYFYQYSNEELYKILSTYCGRQAITLHTSSEQLSDACRGRARDAFLLSQNIIRYCRSNKIKVLQDHNWHELCDIFGIYSRGLKHSEILLMTLIRDVHSISSKNLAVKMGVGVKNVEEELEVRPRELGLVETSSKGRSLTKEGLDYLASLL